MATSPDRTAFVLVPGGFCPALLWRNTTEKLEQQGYVVREVDLPSVVKDRNNSSSSTGRHVTTFADDADAVRAAVAEFADQGKDVVLAGNSYGGSVITEAAKGLNKTEREQAGKKGGSLVHLVYLASLFIDAGMTVNDLVGGKTDAQTASAEDYIAGPPFELLTKLFSELDEEQAKHYAGLVTGRFQSTRAFNQEITYEGHRHVPTTCVITSNDLVLSPELQNEHNDKYIAQSKGNIRKVMLPADHCAMVSHPEDVAAILIEAAKAASS